MRRRQQANTATRSQQCNKSIRQQCTNEHLDVVIVSMVERNIEHVIVSMVESRGVPRESSGEVSRKFPEPNHDPMQHVDST